MSDYDDEWSEEKPKKKNSCRGMAKFPHKQAATQSWDNKRKAGRLPKHQRPYNCKICKAWHDGIPPSFRD